MVCRGDPDANNAIPPDNFPAGLAAKSRPLAGYIMFVHLEQVVCEYKMKMVDFRLCRVNDMHDSET